MCLGHSKASPSMSREDLETEPNASAASVVFPLMFYKGWEEMAKLEPDLERCVQMLDRGVLKVYSLEPIDRM